MKYTLAVITVLLSLCGLYNQAGAQVRSERFLGFKLQGNDAYSVRARTYDGNTPVFENSQDHSAGAEVGYGWFYKDKRSIYFGLISSISHSSSSGNKQWGNAFGFTIQKVNYKTLYKDQLFFSLAQELDYSYSYSRSYSDFGPRHNPSVRSHSIAFLVKPGIFFRYNESLAFTTQLQLLGVRLNMIDFYGPNKTTNFNYDIFSDYSFSSIQLGVVWFPFSKAKNNP